MTHDYTASDTLFLDWRDIHRDSLALADRLESLGPFRGIVAVARGGLVPAAIVARRLRLRLVDTVCVASYEHRRQGGVEVLKPLQGDGDGWLVVDDLADSGLTARTVRTMLPKARYAVVYAKPLGRPDVDVWQVAVDQGVWLEFPWDSDTG